MRLRLARALSPTPASGSTGAPSLMLAVAWSGAAVFAGALLYSAYFYLVELGRLTAVPAAAVPGRVAVNLALFSAFALHHSAAARLGFKARVSRLVPHPCERSLYVWIASLLFLAVCLLWQPLPGVAWEARGLGRWALHAVQLGGVILTLQSAARIDIWELAGVRQLRRFTTDGADKGAADDADDADLAQTTGAGSEAGETRKDPSQAAFQLDESASSASSAAVAASGLNISGPYRWVRHPIYLGWVLMVFGAPAMTTGRLLFAGVSTLYLIVAIPFEERSLTAEFGPSYTAYKRQVRSRLVPGVW